MTNLTYNCTTKDGRKVTVKTYFEALQIKEQGGSFSKVFAKVEEPYKVAPDRFEKLRKVFGQGGN